MDSAPWIWICEQLCCGALIFFFTHLLAVFQAVSPKPTSGIKYPEKRSKTQLFGARSSAECRSVTLVTWWPVLPLNSDASRREVVFTSSAARPFSPPSHCSAASAGSQAALRLLTPQESKRWRLASRLFLARKLLSANARRLALSRGTRC